MSTTSPGGMQDDRLWARHPLNKRLIMVLYVYIYIFSIFASLLMFYFILAKKNYGDILSI
jgi:hypothetical protein